MEIASFGFNPTFHTDLSCFDCTPGQVSANLHAALMRALPHVRKDSLYVSGIAIRPTLAGILTDVVPGLQDVAGQP